MRLPPYRAEGRRRVFRDANEQIDWTLFIANLRIWCSDKTKKNDDDLMMVGRLLGEGVAADLEALLQSCGISSATPLNSLCNSVYFLFDVQI